MRRGLGFHNRRSPGVAIFSPAQLFAGGVNGAWFDPSDSTTLFDDRAGTTPCAAPGAGALVPVGRMLDKSGNANHATAANDTTARPELSARVNLLERTEDISNAAWTRTNVTAASVTSLLETTTNGTHNCNQFVNFVSGVLYTVRYKIKPNGRTRVAIAGGGGLGGLASTGQFYELSGSGSVVNTLSGITATISLQTDGYYLCSLTVTPSGTASIPIGVYLSDGGTNLSYAGDVTKGVDVTAADIRPANIGTTIPAYQRVADQYTYDTVGFPRYLAFNGTSSAMSTPANVNLSGTDKATWFLGARKISDVSWKWAFAFNNPVGNSSFGLTLPEDAGQPNMGFYLRGTASVTYVPTGYVAPLNLVLSAACDLAAATKATSLVPKVNGTVQQTAGSGTTPGGGTFASAILSIGGYSVQLFQGNIYSLLVVGSAVSAGNITATEQWIANKEGVVI